MEQFKIMPILTFKSLVKKHVRSFFEKRGFLEVDAPILVPCPGTEAYLRYFETRWFDQYNQKQQRLFLRSSPELFMKTLLCKGASKIFSLGPCFRNGGEQGPWHRPEFTMLEWYEVGLSFTALMDQTEELIREVYDALDGSLTSFSLQAPPPSFQRISVFEAFEEFADLTLVDEDQDLARKARLKHVQSVQEGDDFSTAFFKILMEKVEPALEACGGSVLYDYPASQAALARVENGRAKRMEFYWGRIELCNGFFELTDPVLNQKRFAETMLQRKSLGFETMEYDPEFSTWISNPGMPPSSGNALGLDRLMSLYLGLNSLICDQPLFGA